MIGKITLIYKPHVRYIYKPHQHIWAETNLTIAPCLPTLDLFGSSFNKSIWWDIRYRILQPRHHQIMESQNVCPERYVGFTVDGGSEFAALPNHVCCKFESLINKFFTFVPAAMQFWSLNGEHSFLQRVTTNSGTGKWEYVEKYSINRQENRETWTYPHPTWWNL